MTPEKSPRDMNTISVSRRLNKYKKVKFTRTQNLLTGETPLTEEEIKVNIFGIAFFIDPVCAICLYPENLIEVGFFRTI